MLRMSLGGLQRVLEPEKDETMARAEEGEVSSDTIIGVLDRPGEAEHEETKEGCGLEEHSSTIYRSPNSLCTFARVTRHTCVLQ